MKKMIATIWEYAEPVAGEAGCDIWDIEYLKEGGQWYLRVYIDKPEGVGIDDCERVSRQLEKVLDREDPIPGSYIFEVSSAGAERPLKRPSDYLRFIGHKVEVRLYKAVNGSKVFHGTLSEYQDGDVTISAGDERFTFKKEQISKVRLRI